MNNNKIDIILLIETFMNFMNYYLFSAKFLNGKRKNIQVKITLSNY